MAAAPMTAEGMIDDAVVTGCHQRREVDEMRHNKNFSLWPAIDDEPSAVRAARQGFYAAICCSAVTAIVAILSGLGFQMTGFNLWCLSDAVLMGALAMGIRRMSRTAAVVALVYYLAGRIDLWAQYGVTSPILAGFFVLMFLSAIRGTFAYHRIKAGIRPESFDTGSVASPNEAFSIGRAI